MARDDRPTGPIDNAPATASAVSDGDSWGQLRAINEQLLLAGLREQQLAEQLRHQLAFTDAITANLGEGLCVLDQEGRVSMANPVAAGLLGWTEAELRGRNLADVVQHWRDAARPLVEAIRAGLTNRNDDDLFARRDGTRLPVAYTVAPIVVDGRPSGMVVTFRDITSARRAAERQRFLGGTGATLAESLDYEATVAEVARLAIPYLADWCFADVLAEDGHAERLALAHADPTASALAAALRRFTASPAKHPQDPTSRALGAGRVVFRPTIAEAQLRAMAQDDAHLRVLLAVGPCSLLAVPLITQGRTLGVLTFLTTTASGRHFAADDVALAEELARRCALALANTRLYRQEQEAVRLREQFLTIAAHELRTPTSAIQGYLEMLRRQFERPDQDRARLGRYLDQCDEGVRRIGLLIHNLLDVARSQQGQLALQFAPFDLTALAREVLARFTPTAAQTPGQTLTLDAPGALAGYGDRDRLDQVLTNLVANALKYSPEGGAARLGVRRDATGWAVITMSDEGRGIPLAAQRTLFQPFARGVAAAGRIGGTGLGLYIVRQIVEGHGGRIALESAPGVGTTVTISLPPAPPEFAPPPAANGV